MKEQQTFRVVLRRENGRFVREYTRGSRYAAKKLVRTLNTKYDDSYYAEIAEPAPNGGYPK